MLTPTLKSIILDRQYYVGSEGYTEKWITYNNPYFSAKELTVDPGQTVIVTDDAAYGCVLVQGYGKFGVYDAEAAIMVRINQRTADEYFVSKMAAEKGVTITNSSMFEPLVILKHFADDLICQL